MKRLDKAIGWLTQIARDGESHFAEGLYYLDVPGSEGDYCWDCAVEEIAWIRRQLQLCCWALYDIAESAKTHIECVVNWYKYPDALHRERLNVVFGLRACLWLWQKLDDANWWADDHTEVEPRRDGGESDSLNFCSCCGASLDTSLTEYGINQELSHWTDSIDGVPSAKKAAELLLSLEGALNYDLDEFDDLGVVLDKLEAVMPAEVRADV